MVLLLKLVQCLKRDCVPADQVRDLINAVGANSFIE